MTRKPLHFIGSSLEVVQQIFRSFVAVARSVPSSASIHLSHGKAVTQSDRLEAGQKFSGHAAASCLAGLSSDSICM